MHGWPNSLEIFKELGETTSDNPENSANYPPVAAAGVTMFMFHIFDHQTSEDHRATCAGGGGDQTGWVSQVSRMSWMLRMLRMIRPEHYCLQMSAFILINHGNRAACF